MEEAIRKYEREVRKAYAAFLKGRIWLPDVKIRSEKVIETLFPKPGEERREFERIASQINQRLRKEADEYILNHTLSSLEIERMEKIYDECEDFRKRLHSVARDVFIGPPVGICPYAIAIPRDDLEKVLCHRLEDVVEGCSVLVPAAEQLLPIYLGGPLTSYYKCELTDETLEVVPVGYPSDTSEIESERIEILQRDHTPKGELKPITLMCLRAPYFWEKKIQDLSPDYVQRFWELDRGNKLRYINLLRKDEVIHLLWEAFILKGR